MPSAASELLGAHQGDLEWLLFAKVLVAAVCFRLCARLFSELTHGLKATFEKYIKLSLLRPVVGSAMIIALVFALGTRDYLGLGVHAATADGISIMSSFHAGGATPFSWLWKLLFTAITLSTGFKGGEVTPLFFMGAALGNALGMAMGAPVDLFAAMGFLAVFAGATNTPLACTIMGVELFGPYYVLYFAMGCFIAYLLSGHSGVYSTQRVRLPKLAGLVLPEGFRLAHARHQNILAMTGDGHADGSPQAPQTVVPAEDGLVELAADGGSQQPAEPDNAGTVALGRRRLGVLRAWMPASARLAEHTGWRRLFSQPAYRLLIDRARKQGCHHATAHHQHVGMGTDGRVSAHPGDQPNPRVQICVEIVAEKDWLEQFYLQHQDILANRLTIYNEFDRWSPPE